ncbi:TonB-dependent receptor [Geofilum rubicundum]|uniref:TonB-dependent receptor n=1 Tax=Geofilum rubicundum JCM 15548 TaxID=1236989 RepID=A0A0E9LS50_9BACT|nr:TonB-dependent receptor [Geofilum rubicundum]GAO28079.1 TonB-dependent receptor [Geofilum rubicundum JCM 15548]
MFLRQILLIGFSLLYVVADGQTISGDNPVMLNEVTVRSNRLEAYSVGAVTESPDSTLTKMLLSSSLSDLLSVSTGLALRTYGPGGLSSVSMRGGGSAHTAVIWNGINIQSPMNSGVNLSVMPVAFMGDVKVQYGGAGTLYGSGAMAGVLHLSGSNIFTHKNGGYLNTGVGSFGKKDIMLGAKIGNQKAAGTISVFAGESDNDFDFFNTSRPDNKRQKQSNADYQQYGFLQENHIRTTRNSLLTTGIWYQHYDKNIQTMMTNSRPNEQNQIDNNLTGTLNYKYYTEFFQLNIKQGVIWNEVDYIDLAIHSNSGNNQSLSLVSEIETRFNLTDGQIWSVGINFTNESGKSDGYIETQSRDRLAAFSFFQFQSFNKRLTSVISARNEMSDGNIHPFVFAYGGELPLTSALSLLGNISRNYRIPTFNDIYWKEDTWSRGNPDLSPESGWSGDASLKYKLRKESIASDFSATGFVTFVDDWIVWLQGSDAIWMPTNKKSGKSMGVELRWNNQISLGKSAIGAKIHYNYTHSRLKTDDVYDGKQMIYTPRHRLNGIFTWSGKLVTSGFSLNGAGKRYYDYENSLKPYLLGDLFTTIHLPALPVKSELSLKIRNVWNTRYQIMAWYAMPLRHYEASLNIRF